MRIGVALLALATLALQLFNHAAADRGASQIIAAYRPRRKHPELFDAAAGWSRWIDPALLDAMTELKMGNDTAIRSLLRVEVEGDSSSVYSFAIFNDEFCDLFLEELDHFYASGLPISRPNSMNNYGVIVNHIGMQPVISKLQNEILFPLSELLYPTQAKGGFTGHHSFMVKYKADEDLGLDMHTDDSDVTFNMCLGRNFTAATLTICGDSRMPKHRQFYKSYEHERGRALIHLGSRRHGADDIQTGAARPRGWEAEQPSLPCRAAHRPTRPTRAAHTPHTRRTHAAHTPHTRRTHAAHTPHTPRTHAAASLRRGAQQPDHLELEPALPRLARVRQQAALPEGGRGARPPLPLVYARPRLSRLPRLPSGQGGVRGQRLVPTAPRVLR